MLRTRICELLGIEHPIISAPMAGTATATLAAAVSEAGGFGMIGAGVNPDPSWVRDQIQTARELTSRPFGVGFISSPPPQASSEVTAKAVTKRNIFLIRTFLI